MTKFQAHRRKWQNCTLCPLHSRRARVVLVRGRLPCDILFVGEAPGASENILGSPFVGPAGHELDRWIEAARIVERELSYALTNLVGCIPLSEKEVGIHQPSRESILACQPRLLELIGIGSPQLLVAVGELALAYLKSMGLSIPIAPIIHPAAVLRKPIAQRSISAREAIRKLCGSLADLMIPF